jgi:hypothetical protein
MHAQHLPGRAAKFSAGHLWHLKSHLDFHWKPVRTELYRETTGSPLTVSQCPPKPTEVKKKTQMQIGTSRIHFNAHDKYIFPSRSKIKLLNVVTNKAAIHKWMKDDNLAQHLMHAQHLPGRAAKFSAGHLWHL